MKRKLLLLYTLMTYLVGYGQTPFTDSNWAIEFEDNFNGSAVNTTDWNYAPPWSSCHGDAGLTTSSNNRKVEGGILKLMIRKETCQCTRWDGVVFNKNYSSGALYSTDLYKYGYFEIRCKIPELAGSSYTGRGLGPNFWFWPLPANSYDPSITDVRWSEIDIFEFDGEYNLHTCNVHYEDIYHDNGGDGPYWSLRQDYLYDFQVDFSSYHKFGCEWTPNYISFYFDDKLIRTTYTEFANDLIPMNMIVDINIPAFGKTPALNSLFPYTYEVDYVKVYKLTMDCTTDIPQSSFNYSTFDNKVKRNITIGGSNGMVPNGESISLRATQSITLNDGFEVPVGSEFYANNCDCEN
jgi:beta-glucanase (GH16 family)